jgi:4,5-DOPA dioxygenase extradiol
VPQPLPTVFVSHGSPMLALERTSPAHRFLQTLPEKLPERPRAVLCVTAHWETAEPVAGTAATPATIHDFHGFPRPLYDIQYPAPGAPDVAEEAVYHLIKEGFTATTDEERGLDHGSWMPLALAWPDADIPVAQLAVQPARGALHHLRMGRALEPLRHKGVLILGSGGAVHNLRHWRQYGDVVAPWARTFDDSLVAAAEAGDGNGLCSLVRTEDGRLAHPRDEHYLPLLVAFGAAGEEAKGTVLHRGFEHGSLSMAAFAFDVPNHGGQPQ